MGAIHGRGYYDRIGLGEACFSGARGRCRGSDGSAQAASACAGSGVLQSTAALSSWPGGVRDGALLGAGVARAWPRGAADAGAIREGVHQAQQARCRRCRSDLRGGPAPDDALCAGQDGRPASCRAAAPWPGAAGAPAYGFGERFARTSGRVRRDRAAYYASATFKALDGSTQSWRRRALDAVCERHGTKPVSLMQGKHVRVLRDELADRPGAARNRLKALRALFRWATEADEAPHDPTRDVKAITYTTKGHHTWTLEEVETFELCHPVGSKARLAMALMLYTTCRREDAVRLGPQHIRNGRLRYRQAKNEHRSPIDCDIPLHSDLAEIIAA